MDLLLYSDETRQLIEECKRLAVMGDPSAAKKLKALEKTAKDADDKALLGFVYFYTANLHYDNARFELFYRDLKRAIENLLLSGEYEKLARAYNFFASAAQEIDAYDIAYSYYNIALNFIDEEKSATVAGIVWGNLGGLHYELGDYLQARSCYRKALRIIKKDSSDPFYYRNSIVCRINDGLNSIALGDIAAAERALRQTTREYNKTDDAFLGDGRFIFSFFEARLALIKGEWATFYKKADYIIEVLSTEEEPYFYMSNIRDFCQMLIEKGQEAVALMILEAIEDGVMKSGVEPAIRSFLESMIDYYEKVGNEKKMVEALLKHQKFLSAQREDQRKIYIHTLDLVNLLGDLQDEEMNVRLKNEILQIQVETDALTQIPNRYSMEKELELAIDRSRRNAQSMAVVVMDIDDFKTYNDTFGHRAGDICLREIGNIMKEYFSDKKVFFARYGGDEFVMIYENMDEKEVRATAKTFASLVKNSSEAKKMRREVTVSQGICMGVPGPETKAWIYIAEADTAMYKTKEANKKNSGRGTGVSMRKLPRKV